MNYLKLGLPIFRDILNSRCLYHLLRLSKSLDAVFMLLKQKEHDKKISIIVSKRVWVSPRFILLGELGYWLSQPVADKRRRASRAVSASSGSFQPRVWSGGNLPFVGKFPPLNIIYIYVNKYRTLHQTQMVYIPISINELFSFSCLIFCKYAFC